MCVNAEKYCRHWRVSGQTQCCRQWCVSMQKNAADTDECQGKQNAADTDMCQCRKMLLTLTSVRANKMLPTLMCARANVVLICKQWLMSMQTEYCRHWRVSLWTLCWWHKQRSRVTTQSSCLFVMLTSVHSKPGIGMYLWHWWSFMQTQVFRWRHWRVSMQAVAVHIDVNILQFYIFVFVISSSMFTALLQIFLYRAWLFGACSMLLHCSACSECEPRIKSLHSCCYVRQSISILIVFTTRHVTCNQGMWHCVLMCCIKVSTQT